MSAVRTSQLRMRLRLETLKRNRFVRALGEVVVART